jgi:hypothetical protein
MNEKSTRRYGPVPSKQSTIVLFLIAVMGGIHVGSVPTNVAARFRGDTAKDTFASARGVLSRWFEIFRLEESGFILGIPSGCSLNLKLNDYSFEGVMVIRTDLSEDLTQIRLIWEIPQAQSRMGLRC